MNEKLDSINKLLEKAGKKNMTISDLRSQLMSPPPESRGRNQLTVDS